MEIREARSDEFETIGELTVEAYRAIGHVDPGYEDVLSDVADRARSASVLVADDAGRVIGAVTYVGNPGPYAEFDGDGDAGIRMLAVDPTRQRAGTGQALVAHCVARARREGKTRVVLHSTPAMTAAHRIYGRLGFVRTPAIDWQPTPTIELWGFVLELAEARSITTS